jgi:hypothetical protein
MGQRLCRRVVSGRWHVAKAWALSVTDVEL